MADFDITALIFSEHDLFRRAFVELEALPDAAGPDPSELERRWRELADSLEVHASGEEVVFYPELLSEVPGSEGETKHAIHDHNEIRDAVRAVAGHEVGSESWWAAVRHAREVNAEHLDEEERDLLPGFRERVDAGQRSELGMRWLAFHEEHERARGLSGRDKDPDEYVEQHT